MSEKAKHTEMDAIAELAMNLGRPIEHVQDGVGYAPYALVPEGTQVKSLEDLAEVPRRIKAQVRMARAESFIRYVNQFKGPGTVICVHTDNHNILATFDWHEGPDKPKWGSHRLQYDINTTDSWDAWFVGKGEELDQKSFAEFLEEHAADIVDPPAADMLQVALNLQARTKVEFTSGVRLDNGNVSVGYVETTEAKAGQKGNMEVPYKFRLGLQVFEDGPRYGIEALLRYRINGGKLFFRYLLINPNDVIKAALEEIADNIEKETGLKPYWE